MHACMCYCHYYYILSQTNYKINSPAYKTNNPKKKQPNFAKTEPAKTSTFKSLGQPNLGQLPWEPPMGPKKLANEKAASEMPCIMPWLFRGESGNRGSWRKVAKKKQPPRLAYNISHPTRMNVEKYFYIFSIGNLCFHSDSLQPHFNRDIL